LRSSGKIHQELAEARRKAEDKNQALAKALEEASRKGLPVTCPNLYCPVVISKVASDFQFFFENGLRLCKKEARESVSVAAGDEVKDEVKVTAAQTEALRAVAEKSG